MININNRGHSLGEAFRLSEQDLQKAQYFLDFFNQCECLSKTIERIWIDENTNDNTKAFALFTVGRCYEYNRIKNHIREED